MTPATFLHHWNIAENPFRGEEARQDQVFSRLITGGGAAGGVEGQALSAAAQHAELEKVAGDFVRPASSVVFGEKGSGKTAMRLQITHQAALHNAKYADARVLLVAHDDLNPMLERLHARLKRTTRKGETTPADSFKQMRLADHIDAIMFMIVPRLVDAVLGPQPGVAVMGAGATTTVGGLPNPEVFNLGPEPKKVLRRTDPAVKREMLVLAAAYDRAEEAGNRTRALRWALGIRRPILDRIQAGLAFFGWLAPAAIAAWLALSARRTGGVPADGSGVSATEAVPWWSFVKSVPDWFGLTGAGDSRTVVWTTAFFTALGVWIVFLGKRAWTDRFRLGRQAARLYKQVRVTGRGESSFKASVRALPAFMRGSNFLPLGDSEEQRLRMFERLRRVLRLFGYTGLIIVVDRVDEPPLVGGDTDRMKSIIWPMLTSKFLQQEGVGLKLLLPIELRHMLFRESAAFFQQARMDKQNMVEQLGWTGATLYDLCNARLAACRQAAPAQNGDSAPPVCLADLFASDVGREGLIEALDSMRQPRDAFKLLYHCINEHCATATDEIGPWKISRATLDAVKKQQSERVRQLALGVRPA